MASRPHLRSQPSCDSEVGCITCGDVGVPMRVLRIDAERGLALCRDESGQRSTVEIALVEPTTVGDHILVHAGTAIVRLDSEAVTA
jgi:hydrogenase assembly chaperone HypC/HupF